ncbi:hypothetical protein [Ornithinibacillus bavariensis]|uniref:Carboxypeptidase regulatory-like domain-containing protein n=1 Tax=Ornithinibacillus bavariensis TaxID=545502 RepID=A0A920C8Y4_9BACI|nr:hypothetical protein [Ornithinibacillus bavariensis]GIO28704.1 hypothetical protein J43TS3_33150 [Ornithinibacillus bavariensis]
MRIKMKVKHLVFMIIGMLTLISFLSFFVFPYIEIYVAEKNITAGKVEEKQEILDLLRTTQMETKKYDLIQEYMIGDGLLTNFDIYIGPSLTHWANEDQNYIEFSWEEKEPFIREYVMQAPPNGFLVTAAKMLASHYEMEGDLEKAKHTLFDASKRFSPLEEYHRNELLVERIRLTKNHDQFTEANQYIEELLQELGTENYDTLAQVTQLRTEIILAQGILNEAHEEVTKAIKEYEKEFNEEQKKWQDSSDEDESIEEDKVENRVVYQQLTSLERSLSMAMEKGTVDVVSVSGKVVRSDGTPMRGVGVFLRDESSVNQSVGPDEYYVLTDDEGRFVINGVLPNRYQIFLGFYYDQIDGWTWPIRMDDWIDIDGSKDITYNVTLQELMKIKSPVNQKVIRDDEVTFSWEDVEGAAYYNLSLAYEIEYGSVSTSFKTNLKENEIVVPIEEIYNQTGAVAFGDEDDYDAKSFLAFTNPDNRFYWSVEAFDQHDRLITKSNGHRLDDKTIGNLPFFYLKERDLTRADKLLINKKPEKALEQYKLNYENNPDDIHSLRMIVRLIGMNGDGTTIARDKLAKPYMEELALKTNSAQQLFDIVQHYYDIQNWTEFNTWFKIYSDKVDKLDGYDQSIYASALMKQGKYDEASIEYDKAMKIDKSNRFVGHWIANEIYRNRDLEKAKEIARMYPERPYGEIVLNWEYLVNQMVKEGGGEKEYIQELCHVLDLYFSGQEDKLEKWHSTTKLAAMKQFIDGVQNVD